MFVGSLKASAHGTRTLLTGRLDYHLAARQGIRNGHSCLKMQARFVSCFALWAAAYVSARCFYAAPQRHSLGIAPAVLGHPAGEPRCNHRICGWMKSSAGPSSLGGGAAGALYCVRCTVFVRAAGLRGGGSAAAAAGRPRAAAARVSFLIKVCRYTARWACCFDTDS